MRKFIFSVIAALAVTGGAASASAASANVTPIEVRISVSDLDLSKPSDMQALRLRIKTAVRRACTADKASNVMLYYGGKHCVADATDKVFAELERRSGTALALAK